MSGDIYLYKSYNNILIKTVQLYDEGTADQIFRSPPTTQDSAAAF